MRSGQPEATIGRWRPRPQPDPPAGCSPRAIVADALKSNPANARALLLAADLERQAGNYEEAAAKYRSTLDANSQDPDALSGLALTLVPKNPDEALPFAQRAVSLSPESPGTLTTLGFVYYKEGNYGAAVQNLQRAFDKEPTPSHRYHLGLAYLKSGDRQTGLQFMETAMQQDSALKVSERAWY